MSEWPYVLITFGLPIAFYAAWLKWWQKGCPFLGLLIIMVVAVWGLLWPFYYSPLHEEAFARQATDSRMDPDLVVNGFVLMGWLNGVIGSLPVIWVEISRTLILLVRKRKKRATESR